MFSDNKMIGFLIYASFVTLLTLTGGVSGGDLVSQWGIPKRFEYDDLPGRLPVEGTKEYEHLGRIFKLSSIFQPKMVATKFSIYTRRGQVEDVTYNPNHYCFPDTCHGPFQYDLSALAESGFDPKLRTIVMTPGFLTDDRPDWILLAKDLWLQLEDVNIIMTTWKDGNRFIYSAAVANTPVVGRQISILLYYLAKLHGADLNDQNFLDRIQLVGHSLGAHISGFVGKDFGGRLSRITGLDPAGPDFDSFPRERRLDKRDAKLVTTIHSNRGKLNYVKALTGGVLDVNQQVVSKFQSTGNKQEEPKQEEDSNSLEQIIDGHVFSFNNPWFGIDEQLGDIDFYANDGREQPSCSDFMHICDHGRSTELYGDILRFELARKDQTDSKDWLRANRLLAFSSKSYENFTIGANFGENCPALIGEDHTTNSTLTQCAIPIDLVSPVGELIEELKQDYNIDLDDKDKDYEGSTRFWFKTRDSAPFMGDHYLLRVEVDFEKSFWDESCSVKAEINMAAGGKGQQTFKTETVKGSGLIESDKFHGLAIPFLNPLGGEAKVALNNIIAMSKLAVHGELSSITKHLVKVLPAEVRVSISTSKLDYVMGMDATKNAEMCSLSIKAIQIVPIVEERLNLAANYADPPVRKSSSKSSWFKKSDKPMRKIYLHDPNVLSVNGNAFLVKKLRKLVVKQQ